MSNDDKWEWATSPRYSLLCVTFSKGLEPPEILRRYGANPATARILPHAEATDFYEAALNGGTVLRSGKHELWGFCYEDVGGAGSRPGPLCALSQDTDVVSLFQGGDGTNRLSHWAHGRCLQSFEPHSAGRKPVVDGPLWDLTLASRRIHPERPGILHALEAAATYTGVSLDSTTIAGPLLTAHLRDEERTPDPERSITPSRTRHHNPPPGRPLGSF